MTEIRSVKINYLLALEYRRLSSPWTSTTKLPREKALDTSGALLQMFFSKWYMTTTEALECIPLYCFSPSTLHFHADAPRAAELFVKFKRLRT